MVAVSLIKYMVPESMQWTCNKSLAQFLLPIPLILSSSSLAVLVPKHEMLPSGTQKSFHQIGRCDAREKKDTAINPYYQLEIGLETKRDYICNLEDSQGHGLLLSCPIVKVNVKYSNQEKAEQLKMHILHEWRFGSFR